MQTRAAGTAFPRIPVFGLGAVLLLAVALAAIGVSPAPDTATAIRSQELIFEDRADGAVTVRVPGHTDPFAVLEPGTNGFARSALRGLARERWREDQGPEVPFRLTAWDDGRLTLDDPTTGRRLDLKAFGPTQAETFARLFVIEGGRR